MTTVSALQLDGARILMVRELNVHVLFNFSNHHQTWSTIHLINHNNCSHNIFQISTNFYIVF
jgi:hypothetical protein